MKHPRWRRVDGFPDYEVSETGRVRRVGGGRRYLKPQPAGRHRNYLKVHLGRRGQNMLVHRLVCAAFNGPPPGPGYHADHRDGDTRRNRADNLRWLEGALNIGRRVYRNADGTWTCPADEQMPEGYEMMDEAELDAALEEAGW